ncbi:unnamed protein product, partial [Discosporangium mesarthrocarpum]
MDLIKVINDKINENLDDVVKIEINYFGDVIHRVVGSHDVNATVHRLVPESGPDTDGPGVDREVLTRECLLVPVTIVDTDECGLPQGHPMKH